MWHDFHLIKDAESALGDILFFPVTYRLFRVGREDADALSVNCPTPSKPALSETVTAVIADEERQAKAIQTQNQAGSISLPEISGLCLYVAHDCNLRCSYCYNQQGKIHSPGKMMSPEIAEAAFRRFFTTEGRKYSVSFYGGEPLMNFRAIKKIVAIGRSLEKERNISITFGITTNGTLMNQEIEDFLVKEFEGVVVSIDGDQAVHDAQRSGSKGGSHRRALATVRRLLARGKPYLTVNGVLTRNSVAHYVESLAYLKALGTRNATLNPLRTDPGSDLALDKEDFSHFIQARVNACQSSIEQGLADDPPSEAIRVIANLLTKRKLRRHCGIGAGPAITADGTIYICHGLVEPDFSMGKVTEPENETFYTIQQQFAALDVDHAPTCAVCWARYFCGGTCYAQNIQENGEIEEPSKPYCQWIQSCVETSIREFLKVCADKKQETTRQMIYQQIQNHITQQSG